METAESLGDDTNGADTALRGSVQMGSVQVTLRVQKP